MFRLPPLTPFIKRFFFLLGGIFAATLILDLVVGFPLFELLALAPAPALGWSWQWLTHVLVYPPSPPGFVNALLGIVFLWFMGPPFEAKYGWRETAKLFALATVASAAGGMLGSLFLPTAGVFGVSPLLLALVMALSATIPWGARVSFFGALTMKNATLVIAFAVYVVLSHLFTGDYGGIIASFAAGGAGYGYMKWYNRPRRPKQRKLERPTIKRVGRKFEVVEGGRSGDDDRPKWIN